MTNITNQRTWLSQFLITRGEDYANCYWQQLLLQLLVAGTRLELSATYLVGQCRVGLYWSLGNGDDWINRNNCTQSLLLKLLQENDHCDEVWWISQYRNITPCWTAYWLKFIRPAGNRAVSHSRTNHFGLI